MDMREFIPPATRFADLPATFQMKRGGALRGGRVAYETWGSPNAGRDNVILILGGLSADAHAASHAADPKPGWWEFMLGRGRPIDTDRWFVVCVNALGSCKGSSGPASVNPATGAPYGMDFPDLAVEDIADAAAIVVRSLDVARVSCVIGASMGGMVALALIARHPLIARAHISISSAAIALPFAIALRSLQREVIRRDPLWANGQYTTDKYPEEGMVTARKLGIITYRSASEWKDRFGRRDLAADEQLDKSFCPEFEVELYLEHQARRFARYYDPNCYLYLSRSIDRYDLAESFGSDTATALSHLKLEKALTIGVRTDLLFPLEQQAQIAAGLRDGGVDSQFIALDSPQGHDAFLVDAARFGQVVAGFLGSLGNREVHDCEHSTRPPALSHADSRVPANPWAEPFEYATPKAANDARRRVLSSR